MNLNILSFVVGACIMSSVHAKICEANSLVNSSEKTSEKTSENSQPQSETKSEIRIEVVSTESQGNGTLADAIRFANSKPQENILVVFSESLYGGQNLLSILLPSQFIAKRTGSLTITGSRAKPAKGACEDIMPSPPRLKLLSYELESKPIDSFSCTASGKLWRRNVTLITTDLPHSNKAKELVLFHVQRGAKLTLEGISVVTHLEDAAVTFVNEGILNLLNINIRAHGNANCILNIGNLTMLTSSCSVSGGATGLDSWGVGDLDVVANVSMSLFVVQNKSTGIFAMPSSFPYLINVDSSFVFTLGEGNAMRSVSLSDNKESPIHFRDTVIKSKCSDRLMNESLQRVKRKC